MLSEIFGYSEKIGGIKMIKLKNIKKNFYLGGETIRALDDVNFNVKMGQVQENQLL